MPIEKLGVTIEVHRDGSASIDICNDTCADFRRFLIDKNVNCNDAQSLAEKIGYEILSWVDIARENTEEL